MAQSTRSERSRQDLLGIFQAALRRVEGSAAVSQWLTSHPPPGEVEMVAIGKAAQSMAEGAWERMGEQIRRALLISKTDHLDPRFCQERGWTGIEAAHPVPDATSLQAGEQLLEFLHHGDSGLPLLVLISGGASSLVEVPVEGVDLEFVARTNSWLLGSGMDIVAMNRIRKALSRIKGGGLLSWMGDRDVVLLAISDVPGDLPGAIGSGLLVPEPDLAHRLEHLQLPQWLSERLSAGLVQRRVQGIREHGPELHIVANLEAAKQAAVNHASSLGYEARVEPGLLEGDAAEVGQQLARQLIGGPPGVIVWGGETTVNLPQQPGRGGRNQHLALAAAMVLEGQPGCLMLCAGSDGSDGPTGDAGALVDAQTLTRARQEGVEPEGCLARADSGTLLEIAGDLITTGPTGTNVMDLVIGMKL
ncbi:MAG: DUF4147 domain-containing protein [Candidatus Thiodiazotropha sp.]